MTNTNAEPASLPPPAFYDIEELAARLKVSKRQIHRLKDAGSLPPAIRLGERLLRWRVAEVEEWIRAGCPRLR